MGKKKKELGLDSMGIQKTMRLTDYLGDGIGQLPLNIMSSLVGQLTYFYTEKVGLAAGMVATMLLIAKIFDAFSDLAMGKIMDAGKSPKGKCRPWFSRMAIPAFVSIILLFTVPKNIGSGLQAAYVLIIGFSLLNCLEFFVFRKMKSSSTINHPLCGCESNVIQKKLPFRVQ